jgi:hypothetical protein
MKGLPPSSLQLEKELGKMRCDEPDVNRLLAAFELKEADRVPNFEILIEDRHVERLLGRPAGHTLGSAKGASEDEYVTPPMDPHDYVELCQKIGQDAIGLDALWAPLKRKGADGKLHVIADGSVHTWKDLDEVVPHSWELDIEPRKRYIQQYIESTKGTNIGTTVMTAAVAMTPYQFIVGFEEFMVKIYEDRDFVEKIISMCMDYYVDIVTVACDLGVSFIYIADDIGQKGGLIMSPKVTRELTLRHYERLVNIATSRGVPVALHSCGNATAMLPDFIDLGIVMYNPVEPTSGADIYEMKKKYGKKICFSGNIDIAGVLAFGTPEDVMRDVKHHIDALAPGGGYIVTSSHSVMNHIPHDNFLAMIEATHRYGRYPLGQTAEVTDCFCAQRRRELAQSELVEGTRFTPNSQYGVCPGCGTRAVVYELPTGEMRCGACYAREGWALVHAGPDAGWHHAGGAVMAGGHPLC